MSDQFPQDINNPIPARKEGEPAIPGVEVEILPKQFQSEKEKPEGNVGIIEDSDLPETR